ncbi:MAG: neutral/alkaline non-lysosomal ceramidase N-terminal domain-containing protein [Chloroflexota bacterium]|jgi:neutral ceramidase
MSNYNIGAGLADITDPAIGLVMQGMADPSQVTTGVESRLYARTFIIEDPHSGRRVVLVTADIWSGTEAVKSEVIRRLAVAFNDTYNDDNVLICGTHTHSAPGGFSHHKLYENTGGGFDPHTFACIVSGIVLSIQNAHQNLSSGKIYIAKGDIEACGEQRSLPAYLNNPAAERAKYPGDTDKEIILLKFVALEANGEVPLGILSWYAIHPTDRGQKNTLVNGDNKGWAAHLFEQEMGTDYTARETFVAAFANANCGDVSGNVSTGVPDGAQDRMHMEDHGRKQFERARELFDVATEELDGGVAYRHTRVDMADVQLTDRSGNRTFAAALGLSFAAGSKEDSVPRIQVGAVTMDSFNLKEGLVEGQISPSERLAQGAIIAGLGATFGTTTDSPAFVNGHLPKPIILRPGLLSPPITPNVLPLQIIRIGNLVITAVPGELTTMAGRRLRETVLSALQGDGVNHLALATYANAYSQYITTKEEYDAQHYEGASTLFGPHTLAAYQQEFSKLAQSLINNTQMNSGPNPPTPSAPTVQRVTFRNLSGKSTKIEIFGPKENFNSFVDIHVPLLGSPEINLEPGNDQAYLLPDDLSEFKIRLDGDSQNIAQSIHPQQLVVIERNGTGSVMDYLPPNVPLQDISTIGRFAPSKALHSVLHVMMN